MATISKKFIGANAVDGSKIRLDNNQSLKARNAENTSDVDILALNTTNKIEFASVPILTSDASNGNEIPRLSQVHALLEGLKPKEAVRVASTANIDLSTGGLLEIDGVQLVADDRVLVKDQNDAEQNGIYVVKTDTWVRSADMNIASEVSGAYVAVRQGNSSAGIVYTVSSFAGTLDTDAISFVYFNSVSGIIGGDMIVVSGSNIAVDLAAVSGLESTNVGDVNGQLKIKLEASNPSLQITGSNELGIKIEAAKGLSVGADGLKVDLDALGGLEFGTNGIQINVDVNTLALDGGNGELKVFIEANKGLVSGGSGIAVDLSNTGAITFDINGRLQVVADDVGVELYDNKIQLKDLGVKAGKIDAFADVLTLDADDITAQYIDLSTKVAESAITEVVIDGVTQTYGVDYDIDNSGVVSRIRFDSVNLPSSDLGISGAASLVAGDVLVVKSIKL